MKLLNIIRKWIFNQQTKASEFHKLLKDSELNSHRAIWFRLCLLIIRNQKNKMEAKNESYDERQANENYRGNESGSP